MAQGMPVVTARRTLPLSLCFRQQGCNPAMYRRHRRAWSAQRAGPLVCVLGNRRLCSTQSLQPRKFSTATAVSFRSLVSLNPHSLVGCERIFDSCRAGAARHWVGGKRAILWAHTNAHWVACLVMPLRDHESMPALLRSRLEISSLLTRYSRRVQSTHRWLHVRSGARPQGRAYSTCSFPGDTRRWPQSCTLFPSWGRATPLETPNLREEDMGSA